MGPALGPTPGAMTDASKRHRDSGEELWSGSEGEDFGWAVPTSEPSQKGKPKPPPGVSSIEEWGRTICGSCRQWPALKLSYAELEKDSTQVDYLTWVIRHESGMAEDLAKFLKAVNFDQKHDLGSLPVPLFPARASFASSSGF